MYTWGSPHLFAPLVRPVLWGWASRFLCFVQFCLLSPRWKCSWTLRSVAAGRGEPSTTINSPNAKGNHQQRVCVYISVGRSRYNHKSASSRLIKKIENIKMLLLHCSAKKKLVSIVVLYYIYTWCTPSSSWWCFSSGQQEEDDDKW